MRGAHQDLSSQTASSIGPDDSANRAGSKKSDPERSKGSRAQAAGSKHASQIQTRMQSMLSRIKGKESRIGSEQTEKEENQLEHPISLHIEAIKPAQSAASQTSTNATQKTFED